MPVNDLDDLAQERRAVVPSSSSGALARSTTRVSSKAALE
jgi:hypothetical protein